MEIAERLASMPHVSLGHFPTPLEFMPSLTRDLGGPRIWMKRDDCTGLASGGNKTRKLEFVLGEVLARGADTILTTGGVQSNHARQTAAACAKLGLRCVLLLVMPPASAGRTYRTSGNLRLDRMFGADIRFLAHGADVAEHMAACAAEVARAGGRPGVIPLGASTPVGALGYARCAVEILAQAKDRGIAVSHVVSAAGSGGTQAGLIAGFAALGADVICEGIDIDAERDRTERRTRDLLPETLDRLGLGGARLPPVHVRGGFAGIAYGVPTRGGRAAIRQIARTEGIVLDAAYTGKAMAALIAGVAEGRYRTGDTVVFLHSGGFPLTFAYPSGNGL